MARSCGWKTWLLTKDFRGWTCKSSTSLRLYSCPPMWWTCPPSPVGPLTHSPGKLGHQTPQATAGAWPPCTTMNHQWVGQVLKKTKQEHGTCASGATSKIWLTCKLICITDHLGEASTLLGISLLIRRGRKGGKHCSRRASSFELPEWLAFGNYH